MATEKELYILTQERAAYIKALHDIYSTACAGTSVYKPGFDKDAHRQVEILIERELIKAEKL